jgi:hypothetical protein
VSIELISTPPNDDCTFHLLFDSVAGVMVLTFETDRVRIRLNYDFQVCLSERIIQIF